jgi:hypothetical protein
VEKLNDVLSRFEQKIVDHNKSADLIPDLP